MAIWVPPIIMVVSDSVVADPVVVAFKIIIQKIKRVGVHPAKVVSIQQE